MRLDPTVVGVQGLVGVPGQPAEHHREEAEGGGDSPADRWSDPAGALERGTNQPADGESDDKGSGKRRSRGRAQSPFAFVAQSTSSRSSRTVRLLWSIFPMRSTASP
jgi:hypothetical protein